MKQHLLSARFGFVLLAGLTLLLLLTSSAGRAAVAQGDEEGSLFMPYAANDTLSPSELDELALETVATEESVSSGSLEIVEKATLSFPASGSVVSEYKIMHTGTYSLYLIALDLVGVRVDREDVVATFAQTLVDVVAPMRLGCAGHPRDRHPLVGQEHGRGFLDALHGSPFLASHRRCPGGAATADRTDDQEPPADQEDHAEHEQREDLDERIARAAEGKGSAVHEVILTKRHSRRR